MIQPQRAEKRGAYLASTRGVSLLCTCTNVYKNAIYCDAFLLLQTCILFLFNMVKVQFTVTLESMLV